MAGITNMKRFIFAALCLGCLVSVNPVLAQDEVRYRKAQKEETAKGNIEKESAAAITVKYGTAGRKDVIPSFDVLDVTYNVDTGLAIEYRKPFNTEEAALKPTTKDD